MAPNPFVELASDPVAFFGWLGYVLLCIMVAVWATGWTLRMVPSLVVQVKKRHGNPDWWGDWLPPKTWTFWAGAIFGVLGLVSFALGGLVWVVAP